MRLNGNIGIRTQAVIKSSSTLAIYNRVIYTVTHSGWDFLLYIILSVFFLFLVSAAQNVFILPNHLTMSKEIIFGEEILIKNVYTRCPTKLYLNLLRYRVSYETCQLWEDLNIVLIFVNFKTKFFIFKIAKAWAILLLLKLV